MSLINENITSEGILSGNTLYAEIAEITNLVVTNFTGGISATTAFINCDLIVTGNTSLQALSATTMVVTTTSGVNQISANTSTDAFRITQLGTGNTFVVQDSTNPDGSPFVIDSSGNVAIGKTSVTSGTLVDLEVAGKTIGINIGNSNTSFMAGTGIFSYGNGIGINGIGRNDFGTVVGIKGESVFDLSADPSATYYGGEFISSGQGGRDYAVRLSDGTEGVGKFLYSVDANGSANWTSQLSGTSATINGPLTIVGNTSLQSFTGTTGTINGTLIVTGDTSLQTFTGRTGTINGNLTVTGNTSLQTFTGTTGTINGPLTVVGNTSLQSFTGTTGRINGNLTVTGNTSLQAFTGTTGTINGNLMVTGNTITTGSISGASLNVTTLPTLNNANSDFLTRNSATGEIERSTPANSAFYAYGIGFAQSIGNYLT